MPLQVAPVLGDPVTLSTGGGWLCKFSPCLKQVLAILQGYVDTNMREGCVWKKQKGRGNDQASLQSTSLPSSAVHLLFLRSYWLASRTDSEAFEQFVDVHTRSHTGPHTHSHTHSHTQPHRTWPVTTRTSWAHWWTSSAPARSISHALHLHSPHPHPTAHNRPKTRSLGRIVGPWMRGP